MSQVEIVKKGVVVNLPAFDTNGNLPPGVYQVSLAEVVARFGQASAQRRILAERLCRIYQLASATGHLARFVVFGSFVTRRALPRDVDVFLLMDASFDASSMAGEAGGLFRQPEADVNVRPGLFWQRHRERTRNTSAFADVHFGASVLWKRRSEPPADETVLMQLWQEEFRDGSRRGIIEIIPARDSEEKR